MIAMTTSSSISVNPRRRLAGQHGLMERFIPGVMTIERAGSRGREAGTQSSHTSLVSVSHDIEARMSPGRSFDVLCPIREKMTGDE